MHRNEKIISFNAYVFNNASRVRIVVLSFLLIRSGIYYIKKKINVNTWGALWGAFFDLLVSTRVSIIVIIIKWKLYPGAPNDVENEQKIYTNNVKWTGKYNGERERRKKNWIQSVRRKYGDARILRSFFVSSLLFFFSWKYAHRPKYVSNNIDIIISDCIQHSWLRNSIVA